VIRGQKCIGKLSNLAMEDSVFDYRSPFACPHGAWALVARKDLAMLRHLPLAALLTLLALVPRVDATAAPRKPVAKKKPVAKAPVAKPAAAALADVVSLALEPETIALNGSRDVQHVVVTAVTQDGATHEVTSSARFTLANPKLARLSNGLLLPVADGATRLTASYGKLTTKPVEVKVTDARGVSPVEFIGDVMPILARNGCNSTACHGSPVGKGGFKLSLFGYEPAEDFQAIAKLADGKRVDLKKPEQSLLLTKATMSTPHAGGMRFKMDSPEYRLLHAWIKDGAPGIGEFEARVKQVRVFPESPWMPSPKAAQRLAVMAEMTDGSVRDVTSKALYSSSDDAIAEVDDQGRVSAKRSGETAVMVRYLGQVAVSRVAVLPAWKLPASAKAEQRGYIDRLVDAKLKKLRLLPSDLCTDEEFVRRVYLDVCGIAPSYEEATTFLADTDPSKRSKLIDALLERPEFVDLWTLKWNDTLRNNPQQTRIGVGPYYSWIRDQIARNRPYDEFVSDLITATGKNTSVVLTEEMLPPQVQVPNPRQLLARLNAGQFNAATNYYAVSKDPLDVTSATSQIFLGVRIECARCHNHPFEKWTQNDYYGLAAFFGNLAVRGGQLVFPTVVAINPFASGIRDPKTNEVVEPKVLDNSEIKVFPRTDQRGALARWITWRDNPFFAKALVNRVWGYYFGRGIVEPVDDFRVTNPASNPELLDALARDFVDRKFDVKEMHRTILNSRVYQQSSRPNQYNRHDVANFARYYPKRLMAEQIYDSISQATGVFLPLNGVGPRGRPGVQAMNPQALIQQSVQGAMPEGQVRRITQLPIPRVPGPTGNFLDTFGKPRREVVCECERSADGNIGQALALINGQDVNGKISTPFGRVSRLVRSIATEPQVVTELYLAALSRKPTAEELQDAGSLLRSARSRQEGAEDLMWSLLNSREFLFIH